MFVRVHVAGLVSPLESLFVASYLLCTIDRLLIDCTVMNWPLDCYCLTVALLLFDCYFVIDLLVYAAN